MCRRFEESHLGHADAQKSLSEIRTRAVQGAGNRQRDADEEHVAGERAHRQTARVYPRRQEVARGG